RPATGSVTRSLLASGSGSPRPASASGSTPSSGGSKLWAPWRGRPAAIRTGAGTTCTSAPEPGPPRPGRKPSEGRDGLSLTPWRARREGRGGQGPRAATYLSLPYRGDKYVARQPAG